VGTHVAVIMLAARSAARLDRVTGKRNMHVLVIPSSYPTAGNPARGCFYREQAQSLARAGLRVGVVAPVIRGLRSLRHEGFRKLTGLSVSDDEGVPTVRRELLARFSLAPRLHGRHWLRVGHDLFRRYVDRFGVPDLIHAHGALLAGRLAVSIADKNGIPFVLTEHNTAFARRAIRPWQDAVIRQVIAQAAARIAVSPQLGRLLASRYETEPTEWQWIPNVVAPEFRPPDGENHAPERMRFRFLNVALLTPKKGHDTLLFALADLLAGGADAELRIVGGGPLQTSLSRLAERLGVASQVTFLGTLDRAAVVAEMQSADAFVLASRHETFGVVLIEALACGLPVVATVCGGPECIVEEQDGLLVPPDDVSALSQGMSRIVATRQKYPAASLRRRCLGRFGEQTVARQIIDVYTQSLGVHPSFWKVGAA
jgi:glycosyltransferase involved in cell wall biosynthesis